MSDDVVRIDGQRLWDSLMELARIGAYVDERTGLTGVNRQTLTDEEAEGRRLVVQWFRDAGLAVRVDRIGNVYARRAGTDPDAAPVLIGSHIDSVATAGAFDGCLGVLGGLEVLRTFDDLGIVTTRPVEVAFFTEEEGARFGVDMLGSAVAVGRIALAEALALTDRAGVALGDELVRHGFDGPEPERVSPPHAYVECHIEQGPVLAAEGLQVGVVTGVQGISWQEVTIHGRAAHAGTTPTELRVDAGLAASHVVVRLREMAESGDFGALRATVGEMRFAPGLTNIVPTRAVFTVDLRNPDDDAMTRAEDALEVFLHELEERWPGLSVSVRRMARTRHVPFDPEVQKAVATAADDLELSHRALLSGAGHDAQELASICPTAMVFVPGLYDGISHNPREYSTPEACADGVSVLATVVRRLAG
ncbi:MAG: Zn-dependent hydrolase [Candidatus Nanopelagicales bacterium]